MAAMGDGREGAGDRHPVSTPGRDPGASQMRR
jgi:hypothetical protein